MKRPFSVTVIAWVLIVAGSVGLVFHIADQWPHPFESENIWISLFRLVAIVCGIFMLRGSNWARWLAVAWIAYHAIISAFHSPVQLVMHCLLTAVFAYVLFRPTANAYYAAGDGGY